MKILCDRKNLEHEVKLIEGLLDERMRCCRAAMLYNISIKTVLGYFYFYIRGYRLIWMRHEVTKYKQKRENNSVRYSLLLVIVEYMLKLISHKTFCANLRLAQDYGYTYFPLPYILKEDVLWQPKTRDIDILYFGRSDVTKSGQLWAMLEKCEDINTLRAGGENFISTEEKNKLFARSKFVLNRYMRPFGQSGVTPDALSFGAAVITSEFDDLTRYDFGGYLIKIDSNLDNAKSLTILKNLIKKYPSANFDRGALTHDFSVTWNLEKNYMALKDACK